MAIAHRPLESLLADAVDNPEFRQMVRALEQHAPSQSAESHVSAAGLAGPAKTLHALLLRRALRQPLLYVTSTNREAEEAFDLLDAWARLVGEAPPALIPAHDIHPYQGLSPHADINEKRALGLAKLAAGEVSLVVLPITALTSRTEPPDFYRALARRIQRGDSIDLNELLEHLSAVGYSPHDPVEMAGQFSLRGGILDLFPPEARRPVRLELFGDEVESIREFDVETQRSVGPVSGVALPPLTEYPLRRDLLDKLSAHLQASTSAKGEAFVPGEPLPGWEFLVPLVQPLSHTLLDLSPSAVLFLDEPEVLRREAERLWNLLEEEHQRAREEGRALVSPSDLYLQWSEITNQLARHAVVHASELGWTASSSGNGSASQAALPTFQFVTRPAPRFHGNLAMCLSELENLLRQDNRVILLTSGQGESDRLAELFGEHHLPFQRAERNSTDLSPGDGTPQDISAAACWIGRGSLPHGVMLPTQRLVVLGHQDLFDTAPAASRPGSARSHISTFLSDFRDLKPGDFVVHVDHGIGCYRGLKEIAAEDAPQEFMELEYRDGDRVYVPLTRLDLVQKYRAMEGATPTLDRLGGGTWARTKSRVKKAMQEMADDLLKLYAERQTATGFAFSDNNPWQHELEESFEFEETPDQMRTIEEVRLDMEKPAPMDRLVCGDVGYGKTEVAMRAAFRAALNGKQVAILTPTTVLAFQHFETLQQRFAAFPIRVELMSRFRTTAQQKETLRQLEAGKVDIVVGTHRLLSKDVVFQDLGLLVVDEEQRFGVRHKERIKEMRKSVDVLSLSATPIPRTLHMALAGLRDMSLIETPPRDRLAIQTVVAPFSENLVQNAISQELERGGQVFFVHNRVQSLPGMAALIQELVPKAIVGMAHGQMDERRLEKVMFQFLKHETNVLVATTIIENGLDIPLVNTIIINRSDRMGLAELYQLRGRVGRSNRRAYAYLLIPPETDLTPLARRRLSALKEFSELGSGFRVAALDMELRGAGNLLGGQQHGHVNAIGLELYCQMMEQAVRELRGEAEQPEVSTTINLGVDLRVPTSYIPEEHQRLRMYKRIGGIRSDTERENVLQELEDRYGSPPRQVRNLLDYASLKLAAERLWISSIERKKEIVQIQFHQKTSVDPTRLMDFISAHPEAQFTPSGALRIPVRGKSSELLTQVQAVLEEFLTH